MSCSDRTLEKQAFLRDFVVGWFPLIAIHSGLLPGPLSWLVVFPTLQAFNLLPSRPRYPGLRFLSKF